MIKDASTASFIKNVVSPPNYNLFIGLKYHPAEEVFRWLDGSLMTYSDWDTPPTLNQHCAGLLPQSDKKWYEYSCSSSRRFICQV